MSRTIRRITAAVLTVVLLTFSSFSAAAADISADDPVSAAHLVTQANPAQNELYVAGIRRLTDDEIEAISDRISSQSKVYLVELRDGRYTYYMTVDFRTDDAVYLSKLPVLRKTSHKLFDRSEQMAMEIYFPDTDTTITKQLFTNKKQSVEEAAKRITTDIASAYNCLYNLSQSGYNDITSLKLLLQQVEEENRNSQEKKAVLQHLKEVLRKIEALEGSTEWQRMEYQLENAMHELLTLQNTYGDEVSQMKVHQLELHVEEVVSCADVRMANLLLANINKYMHSLKILRNYVSWVYYFDSQYELLKWRNAEKARKAIDKALEIVKDKPTTQKLDPLLDLLFELRIVEKKDDAGGSTNANVVERENLLKENPINGLLS